MLGNLVQDIRHGLRLLLLNPGFALVAILSLALGIGANAAIFSVLEGVLLKPLSYPDPDRLIAVDHAAPGVNLTSAGIAPFLYFTYRDKSQTLQDIGMWTGDSLAVTGLAEPEVIPGIDLTDAVLPLLGPRPVLGRLFSRHDDRRWPDNGSGHRASFWTCATSGISSGPNCSG